MSIGGGRRINLDQLLSVLDDVLNLGGKAQRMIWIPSCGEVFHS